MDNEKRKVKNFSRKTIKDDINNHIDTDEPQFEGDYEQNDEFNGIREFNEEADKKQDNKPFKIFGMICMAIAIAAFIFVGSFSANTTQLTQNEIKDGVVNFAPGTILSSNDLTIETKDYTITHKSNDKDTKMWIWDYSAEDGDYVQVFVDDVLLADTFMAKNKPIVFNVPLESKVKVKGIKDGMNGISYAIKFQINGKTYFNLVPEGQTNTYTLVKD